MFIIREVKELWKTQEPKRKKYYKFLVCYDTLRCITIRFLLLLCDGSEAHGEKTKTHNMCSTCMVYVIYFFSLGNVPYIIQHCQYDVAVASRQYSMYSADNVCVNHQFRDAAYGPSHGEVGLLWRRLTGGLQR